MPEFEQERLPVLSIEQQWKMVDRWREALILSASELKQSAQPAHLSVDLAEIGVASQALADLEHAWQAMNKPHYWPPFLDRETHVAQTPIEALMTYIGCGLYPPPELMLSTRHTADLYFVGAGAVTLEECFFGKPKRRAGAYASRRNSNFQEFVWTFRLMSSIRAGKTDIEVAQEIIKEEGLAIDPESLLRRARKHWKKAPPEE